MPVAVFQSRLPIQRYISEEPNHVALMNPRAMLEDPIVPYCARKRFSKMLSEIKKGIPNKIIKLPKAMDSPPRNFIQPFAENNGSLICWIKLTFALISICALDSVIVNPSNLDEIEIMPLFELKIL
jgi:hypothetical protein